MRTYICLGLPRGGTSMVAGLLRIFGINMGDNIDETKHEDLELEIATTEEIKNLILKRNESKKTWGWKTPWIGLFLKDINNFFANPHYIFITRDLVASMNSDIKHNHSYSNRSDPEKYVWYRNLYLINEISRIIKYSNAPILFLSYEESLKRPKELINKMEQFTGITLSLEKRNQAIKFISPGYKEIWNTTKTENY